MENRRNRLEGVKAEIEITRNYLQSPSTMFHPGNRILRSQCADNSAYYTPVKMSARDDQTSDICNRRARERALGIRPSLPPRSSQYVPKLFPVISRILSCVALISLPQLFARFAVTRGSHLRARLALRFSSSRCLSKRCRCDCRFKYRIFRG